MKIVIAALIGVLGAAFVSQQTSLSSVWNTCHPLEVKPLDGHGDTLFLPSAQYRVVQADPLTVEYSGAPTHHTDPTALVEGTVLVADLRCEP